MIRTGARHRHRAGVRRELLLFYGAAALALIVVSIGAVVASKSVARSQALQDAQRMTVRLGTLVVGPLLADALNGDAARLDELNRALEHRMEDGYLSLITVWDADGRVVYSTEDEEIGRTLEAPTEVTAAISDGVVSSDFEEEPEASDKQFVGANPGFVEVYAPLKLPDRPMLAFEAYYDYARVDEIANTLMWELIPLVLVPLIVLQLIQVPIAASLARRVRRHDEERADLLERSLSVSERERIRVAADLHDGPIQDLAGISYALGALSPLIPEQNRGLMDGVQSTVQHSIESLRRLMVDLYPPDMTSEHLPETIAGLADTLRAQDVAVDLRLEPLPEMDKDLVTALYRVAHEGLANVAEHAQASHVTLWLAVETGSGTQDRTVRLQIADNGVGFDTNKLDRRSEGHLGLRLLKDRVEGLGGTLTVRHGAEGGMVIEAALPVHESDRS